jgi:hypothetical protein
VTAQTLAGLRLVAAGLGLAERRLAELTPDETEALALAYREAAARR